jgi:hypothetical protein
MAEAENTSPQADSPTITSSGSGNAATLSGEPLKDLSEPSNGGASAPVEPAEAVRAAADPAVTRSPTALSAEGQSAALKWFVDAAIRDVTGETDPDEEERKTFRINWGTEDKPDYVDWKIREVDGQMLRAIRKREQATREARRTGIVDEYRVNLQVIVAGTVDPDLAAAAKAVSEATGENVSAVDLVDKRFKKRPGFVPQLAAHIMAMSGFDDEAITEQDQVIAAGNS